MSTPTSGPPNGPEHEPPFDTSYGPQPTGSHGADGPMPPGPGGPLPPLPPRPGGGKPSHRTRILAIVGGVVVVLAAGGGLAWAATSGNGDSSAQPSASGTPTAGSSGSTSPSPSASHSKDGKSGKAKKAHRVAGTVTAQSATSWTVRTAKGQSVVVTVGSFTHYGTKEKPATAATYKVGSHVVVVLAAPKHAKGKHTGTASPSSPSTSTPHSPATHKAVRIFTPTPKSSSSKPTASATA